MAKLTITLTSAPPVTIKKDDWPIIARAKWHDGQVECQANRTRTLIVRQHEDGRAIVYGVYSTQWQGESDRRRGVYLADNPNSLHIVRTICEVADSMGFDEDFAEECIANLPAVEV